MELDLVNMNSNTKWQRNNNNQEKSTGPMIVKSNNQYKKTL